MAVLVEPTLGYDPALREEGRALSAALLARLEKGGHLPLDFYPAFRDDGNPESGFTRGAPPPRFAHGYWAARNRFGVLLETHSWHGYRERVAATVDFLRALLELGAERAPAWRAAAARADRAAASLAGKEVVLESAPDGGAKTIRFRGYAYARVESAAFGRPVVSYDESRPTIWEVPLVEGQRPSVSVVLPQGGWIVPAAWAAKVADRLRLHGVLFSRIEGLRQGVPAEAFRASEATFAAASFEGRQRLTVKGGWGSDGMDVPSGSLWIPVAQARALLAAHLLEPTGPDSFLAWGDFNTAFERKEYIEDYALEPYARELLEKNAPFRAAFERRLAEDPALAKDPAARLDFFYERHPSFDRAWRLYPVLRAAARP
jgi:hypothetical protein